MKLAKLRSDALDIFHSGLKAVDPINAVTSYLKRKDQKLEVNNQTYDISTYDRIYVIGMGKAAAAMAQAVEKILRDKLKGGIINVKYGHALPLNIIKVNEAGHPVPDEAGLKGTKEIIRLLEETGKRDLVICLISGGGSALLPCPAEGLTLEDKQRVTRLLLECGARIHEINAVRYHSSRIKGGQLARGANPSTLISLILSDVIGDNLDTIASGPTVPDESTFTDCLNILRKYGIKEKVPGTVLKVLADGSRGELEETPKADDPAFRRTQNVVIGSNILAVKAARQKAYELGYNTLILSSFIEGETKDVAKVHAAIAKEILSSGNPIEKPACIISGGETTVTIRGKGLGGRNQEFALASAIDIDGLEETMILSGGTDGTDGPTDAAGALADATTVRRASGMGLEAELYLDNNDSYNFFKPLGDLIITGPTRTNVMDLRLVLVA